MNLQNLLTSNVVVASSSYMRVLVAFLTLALIEVAGVGTISNSHGAESGNKAARGLLLVANKGDQTLGIIDPVSAHQIATIAENGVTGHEVVASPDGKRAFVPIYGNAGVGKPGTDGQLIRVIDLAKREIVGTIDLGKGDFGDSHGSLSIVSTITRSALSTPLFLNPLAPSPAFDLRQDSQHAVRQVLTPTALVQVSNDTEDGSPYLYKIGFLSRPSPLVDTNGFYLTNGTTLIKEVTVQNPNGSTNYNHTYPVC